MRSDYEALNSQSNPEEVGVDPRRVLLVFAVLLYTFVWLVQSIFTRDLWLNNLLRPYLPGWALLAVGLSAPITVALVALRAIPWKISILFALLLPVQGALFGLVGERYRLVQGAVTAFAFFEVYVLLPRLNRLMAEQKGDGTVLHLK